MIREINTIIESLVENGEVKHIIDLSTGSMMVEADFINIKFKKDFLNTPDDEEYEDAKEIITEEYNKVVEARKVLFDVKKTIVGIRELDKSYNTLQECVYILDSISTAPAYACDCYGIGAKIITLMAFISSPMNDDNKFREVMFRNTFKAYNEVVKAMEFIK